ncbi:MAG: ExbD/TolR family protein [Gemmatimonadales bacterium]
MPVLATALQKDINVAPMIDVLLVLFIAYWVILLLGRHAVDLQVPPRSEVTAEQGPITQIVLELEADGSYAVNGQPVPALELGSFLGRIYRGRPLKLLFIKAAPNRSYQEVIDAVDQAKGAGIQVFAFTPPPGQ